MEKIAVERAVWINAPIQRVWRAVTDAEQLSRWYATNYAWEIPTLAVGATIKFHNSDTEILLATIAVLDPPHQFVVHWQMQPALVTAFILSEENGGTHAVIRETGYELVPEAERQQWLDNTGGGYAMSVENLKAHVEGRPLPY